MRKNNIRKRGDIRFNLIKVVCLRYRDMKGRMSVKKITTILLTAIMVVTMLITPAFAYIIAVQP